jgi:hypothetical protein
LPIGRAVAALVSIAAAVTLVACANSDRDGSQPATTTTVSENPASTTTTKSTPSPRVGSTAASDGSFDVDLPKDWRSEPAEGSLLQLIASNGPNLAVTVNGTAARGRTVQESAEMGEKNLVDRLQAVVDPGGIESTTVDGEPAWRFTYTVPAASMQEPQDTRGRSLYVRHRDIEYLVTFTGTPDTFNAAVADYEAIMDSWKWSN